MPPTGEVYHALAKFRRALLQRERAVSSEMVRVYGATWKRILADLNLLQADYVAWKLAHPEEPWPWIYDYQRLLAFRGQVAQELTRYTQYVYDQIRQEQQDAIAAAQTHAEALTRRALGPAPAGIVITWNRMPTRAVEQIIGLTQQGSPLWALLSGLSSDGAQAAADALIQGLLLGFSPRDTAREIRRALGGALWRSLRIARTETLRAYREATRLSYRENGDILKGWIWHSAADERTCGSCWAMHGTKHTLDETLDDHPNGRCAQVPWTKTWQEIGEMYGIDLSEVPETSVVVESGATLFDRLSREQQISVLGPAKWAAWRDGLITFDDNPMTGIVGRKYDPVWGSMRAERSLKRLGLNINELRRRYLELLESG